MDSGKAEIGNGSGDLNSTQAGRGKLSKKSRSRKLVRWLLVDIAVAAVIVGLLVYRPGRYDPVDSGAFKPGQVSPYLTQLSSDVYNGAQLGEPFYVAVSEEGINDMIARGNWPQEHEGLLLYAPAAVLEPGKVVFMGTANVKGAEFVVTIELTPRIDESGLLNLTVAKLKVGAMNVTPVARIIARQMFSNEIAAGGVDTEAWETKVVASLLIDEAFDPVFPTGDKRISVRMEKLAVEEGKIVAQLTPVR
jgi:hypothetical protein